jgi:hypothetical protein
MKKLFFLLLFICVSNAVFAAANGEGVAFLCDEFRNGKKTEFSYKIEIYISTNHDEKLNWSIDTVVFIAVSSEQGKYTLVRPEHRDNKSPQNDDWKILDDINWKYQKSLKCVYRPDRFTKLLIDAVLENGEWKVTCNGEEIGGDNTRTKIEYRQINSLKLKYNNILPEYLYD